MSALLIVRAQVDPAAREAFDHWYRTEHLPDAARAFAPLSARRGWSELEENVHIAFYEFAGPAALEAVMASDELKQLIAEFDRLWAGKVTRTREVVELIQRI